MDRCNSQMVPADQDILLGDSTASDINAVNEFVDQTSTSRLKTWVFSRTKIIHDSVKRAKRISIHNVQGISTYFPVIRRRNVPQPPDVQTRDNAHINRLQEPPDSGSSPSIFRRIQTSIKSFFR